MSDFLQHRSKYLVLAECIQGVGELHLARQQSEIFANHGHSVLFASGHQGNVTRFNNPNLRSVSLPQLRYNLTSGATEIRSTKHRDADPEEGWYEVYSEQGEALAALRKHQIVELSEDVDSILVMSGWPFWLGDLDEEMTHLLAANSLRGDGRKPISFLTREVCAADSLPTNGPFSVAEILEREECHWFVYGDDQLLPANITFPAVDPNKVSHVGYPHQARQIIHSSEDGDLKRIFVVAGGGDFRESSYEVISAVFDVIDAGTLQNVKWDIVIPLNPTNPPLGKIMADKLRVRALGYGDNINIMDLLETEHFNHELTLCDLLISQGGAGTFANIGGGINALIAPISTQIKVKRRDEERFVHFKEQAIRAETFEQHRFCYTIQPAELEENRFAEKIKEALQTPRIVCSNTIRMGGLKSAAEAIMARRASAANASYLS